MQITSQTATEMRRATRAAATWPGHHPRTARRNETLWFYILISPWLVGFVALTLGPMLASLWLSMTEWDLFQPPKWVGFENYIRLFTKDPIFWKALYNTFYYALLAIPLGLIASLFIAHLLSRPLRGMRIYRTIFYLPSLVPIVATAMLFTWLFAPDAGMINRFLALFGVDGPAWLLDEQWVKPSLVIMSLWGLGASVVLLLAGMQGIPSEFYEAAAIDGASRGQQFRRITLPLLTPVIFFNLIMGIIGALQTFTQVYVITKGAGGAMGGPNNASMMLVPYLFDNAFRFYKMGYASALAWVLFIISLALTLLVLRSSSAWVFYESEVRSR